MYSTLTSLALVLVSALHVLAESHTIRFQNNCGTGTPKLIQAGNTLSSGEDYTSNGLLQSAIAYLQTGDCLLNGENCATVEMNMNNPSCPGCGSSVDLSLIPSHAFNVPVGFTFYGGDGSCDGLGAICSDATCNTAFFKPDDNSVQRACQADNVNLLITFCGGSTTKFTEAVAGSLSGESSSSGSSSSVAVASSSSSTEAATPTSSSSSAVSSAAAPSAVVNVGESSAASPSATASSSSSAASAAPTCSRKNKNSRSRRAKRTSNISRHARAQHRVREFAGFHDSQF